MAFKIVITKIESVHYISKEWVKLFDYTEAEQKEVRFSRQEDIKAQYGYKETPATKEIEIAVLSQVVESFDLVEVIKAINRIAYPQSR